MKMELSYNHILFLIHSMEYFQINIILMLLLFLKKNQVNKYVLIFIIYNFSCCFIGSHLLFAATNLAGFWDSPKFKRE